MYELVQVGEKSYYINCPAKIGVYLADEYNVYLIDSGNDKDAGRKVRQILEKNNWKGIEAAFTQYPILEPSFLYGGYPCKDLRHKFLLAQDSNVTSFSDVNFPKEIEIVPLSGHFFDMVGFRTPDQTVFLADCISSKETLEKYAISFIYDVEAYLKTLDKVETMKAAMFVPAHAEASADVRDLIQYNRKKIYEVAACLREICSEAMTFEQVLQRVFNRYGLVMNFEQYVLVGSTVRSYLSWLKDKGEMNVDFQNNQLLWKSV